MIRAIARFSVRNPVAVNLATITVVLAGLASYLRMPREVFPDFSTGTVLVNTIYPGASAEDVERLVTLPIEERVEGTDGLKGMTSRSQESLSFLSLELHDDAEVGRFVEDVRSAILAGDLELPEDCEDPIVTELVSEFPVIAVHVYGDADEDVLKEVADRHKRELERIPGVSQVLPQGVLEPRIWVEVDPVALERFGLTLEEVGRAVGGRSAEAPAGSLQTDSGDYLLRVESEVLRAEDLRKAPVIQRPDGVVVRLHQVARVVDAYERPTIRGSFNGKPSIYLRVNKKPTGDTIAISRQVWDYIERENPDMPPGVSLGANSDLAVYVRNRLNTMRDSATLGGLLVLCALVAFLSVRVAGMTALGIPVSFLGGILVAGMLGYTMNMMTQFALIVVLGMIVDDAIVVAENVFRHIEEGLSPEEAAVVGTAEVGKPVLATILTTMAAFLPMGLMMGGVMGEFMRPIPIVVSLCLAASLWEALMVLPAHLAHWTGGRVATQVKHTRHWYDPLRDRYVRALRFFVRWRWATVFGVLAVTFLAAGMMRYRIPFVLFDDFEAKVFAVNLRARTGTSLADTQEMMKEVERRAVAALEEGELESTNTLAGVSFDDANVFSTGQHLGQVWVELREGVEGRRTTAEILEAMRATYRVLPEGAESIEIMQPQAGPVGRAIDLSIRGPELDELRAIAGEVKGLLAGFAGVRDVRAEDEPGKRAVRVRLRDEGRMLGFTEAGLGRTLRTAFEGVRAARVRRGEDDVEIHVKLPEETRLERGSLARLRVPIPGAAPATVGASATAAGAGDAPPPSIPLDVVADLEEATGLDVITRDDGQRSIRVTADVNKEEGNASEIAAAIEEGWRDIAARHPGYTLAFQGAQEDTQESMDGLLAALVLSVLLIYMILGTTFSSFSQPLVIMLAIPFGIIGMVVGHFAMDRVISFMSLTGLVALSGIVVNDSLILVDFVNRRREAGDGLVQAILTAGGHRFRPILLTSVTTMLGLSPLTFFASGQARFLQPMAITIFFGLACSTFLILVVVPCAYGMLMDLTTLLAHPRRTLGRMWRNEEVHDLIAPPVDRSPALES